MHQMIRTLAISGLLVLAAVSGVSGRNYTTTFGGSNENPLSEGGNWINGQAAGFDWSNCALSNHLAYGAQTNGYLGNVFNDPPRCWRAHGDCLRA